MKLGDPLDEAKTYAEPRRRLRVLFPMLVHSIEYVRKAIGRDATPVIRHGDFYLIGCDSLVDANLAACRRIPDRVLQQIDECLR